MVLFLILKSLLCKLLIKQPYQSLYPKSFVKVCCRDCTILKDEYLCDAILIDLCGLCGYVGEIASQHVTSEIVVLLYF
jgi:hypothetical protein